MMNAGKALMSLWTGRMTVTVREQVKNEETKQMEFAEKNVIENAPCRLSYSAAAPVRDSGGAPEIGQTVKIFCAPAPDIPEGSKIVIEQNGRTAAYKRSGTPAVYTNHQEITLELFERWA